jgi:hypothetical protein
MIEEIKLVEWRENVEARLAFSWAVVQQLLEEVEAQRCAVERLRAELAEKAADPKTGAALQIVELPAACPIWRGRTCGFLALGDEPAQAEQRAMGVGQR